MALAVTVFFLLMLRINASLFLAQEPLYDFVTKGDQAVLQIPCMDKVADVTVYRLNPDKSRVVSNYTLRHSNTAYFLINISENQEYFSECRKNGLLMEKRCFLVIVCAQKKEKETMYYLHGETVRISCQKFSSNRGETLQVFQNVKPWDLICRTFSPSQERVILSDDKFQEMLNATQTNNYALVIPHLLPSDTGKYTCCSQLEEFNEANIFVCSILDPINITFALGDSAGLMCVFNLSYFPRVQWYREYNQSSEYLLVDRKDHFVKEDMKKRLNASDPNHITITELSIQDGGSYWCRVWELNDIPRGWCFSRRVHLTYVTPQLDTFYSVYASLMSLMLLGMISAVVFVTIVSRNRRTRELCDDN